MKILKIFNLHLFLDCARDMSVRGWKTALCPLGKKFTFIFFKNKLSKYAIIELHNNLKLDTDIAHIEPLQN
jgi:hypothetical protein